MKILNWLAMFGISSDSHEKFKTFFKEQSGHEIDVEKDIHTENDDKVIDLTLYASDFVAKNGADTYE